jgi:hypothetical protein
MKTWSAHALKAGYEKRVLGFDLRSTVRPVLRPLKMTDSNQHERGASATTIDPELWPQHEPDKYEHDRNGLNLINDSSNGLCDSSQPSTAVLVAFDIPSTLFEQLAGTFGLRRINESQIFASPRWECVGFDVVDFRTQSSALYSFDFTKQQEDQLRRILPFPLNQHGLISDEGSAISACEPFDLAVPDHAPFSPCGVWLLRTPQLPQR